MLQKAAQITLDGSGFGDFQFQCNNPAMTWDVTQINVSTGTANPNCACICLLNGQYMCGTVSGASDVASGTPDIVMNASDTLDIKWGFGNAHDTATVVIYYTENAI